MNIKKELEHIKRIYDFELTSEQVQALDIAIESLEQDQETKEKMWAKQLNECEECEVINNELKKENENDSKDDR